MGSSPTPESVHRTAQACRAVLREIHRRVDLTVSNAAVKAELRHGVKAAESALAMMGRSVLAPPRRSDSNAGASALSSLDAQDRANHDRGSASPVPHPVKRSPPALPANTSPVTASERGMGPITTADALGRTPTAEAPLTVKGEPSARPSTDSAGSPPRQGCAVSVEDDANRAEKRSSNPSLSHGRAASARRPTGTATECSSSLPLCTAFQSAAVWGYVLSAVFWKRRKLTEYTITALELLLRDMPVPFDLLVTVIVDPSLLCPEAPVGSGGASKGRRASRRPGRMSVSVATGVFYALSECILQSFSEPTVQTRALRLVCELVSSRPHPPRRSREGAGSPSGGREADGFTARRSHSEAFGMAGSFRGHTAIRVIESCFKAAAGGMQDTARYAAHLALRAAVHRIVHAFVAMGKYDGALGGTDSHATAHAVFSTDTILADYTVDVDNNEPYTWIHVVPSKRMEVVPPASPRSGCFPAVPIATATAPCSSDQPFVDAAAQLQQEQEASSETVSAPTAFPSPHHAEQPLCSGDRENGGGEWALNVPASSSKPPVPDEAPTLSLQLVSDEPHSNEGDSDLTKSPLRSQRSFTTGASPAATPLSFHSSPSLMNLSFDPHTLFRNSVDESLVLHALSTLGTVDGALPSPLKDLLIVVRRMCRCASCPCSGTPNAANSDVRVRALGLWVLECVLDELPAANCEQEHRCATWMSLVLHACKYELLGCLVKNLAMAVPFTFFERAAHLLGTLLRKLHYHMARELHTLLGAFLFPLMVSQYASFRQKHAVLSMIRQLFTVPHLCVSLFINYDCNPAFDPGAEYGGMLELLVEHVVEMTFLDHVDANGDAYPWLSSDQQQLLRSESVVVIHTLMTSLHRWIAEDPRAYAESLRRSAQNDLRRRQQPKGGDLTGGTESRELYRDSWGSVEVADLQPPLAGSHSATATASGRDSGGGGEENYSPGQRESHIRDQASPLDGPSGAPFPKWGRENSVRYHWKHIHYLLHNKRIAQEAVQRINAGRWREAKEFLESRGFMVATTPSESERADPASVAAGTSSYALFARFLFEYPGISREALSAIFEKVNSKDGAPRLVLQEYLHCFHYTDVPVDVAMRDTTCKFMSWERPMFEAKVWETIQECFGNEYARQNPSSITARDADVMAGVLLFLHSNLHNRVAKGDRMPVAQFVRDANACLEFPMMAEDLHAMFRRVLNRKWELDIYGRTPQQAEKEGTLVRLSAKIQMERAAQRRHQGAANTNSSTANAKGTTVPTGSPVFRDVSGVTASAEAAARAAASKDGLILDADPEAFEDVLQGAEGNDAPSAHDSFLTPRTAAAAPAPTAASASIPEASPMDGSPLHVWVSDDVALLDSTIPAYADNKATLKTKEAQHHAFHEVSAMYLHKLESVHRLYCIESEAYRPQPYVVPCYAEHVRQMLLLTYPHIMSCVYMGFRILEEAPIARKLLDTVQITYDIAAAFVLNLRDLRPVMEEVLQRYLDDGRAYRLLPTSRATFVPFLLNVL
ncbi:hypothetical protein LSCM1_01927 [Leishmania martiniquensis]|uniref:SEC7 domain-containing protein n=1 Tax=Leishmania martiniquensis TaxID=1580590 RepID=A0A836H4E4_9TRYP|nr:hypothetical protein LSCM1_01927 [Leishmania martiniquensis]